MCSPVVLPKPEMFVALLVTFLSPIAHSGELPGGDALQFITETAGPIFDRACERAMDQVPRFQVDEEHWLLFDAVISFQVTRRVYVDPDRDEEILSGPIEMRTGQELNRLFKKAPPMLRVATEFLSPERIDLLVRAFHSTEERSGMESRFFGLVRVHRRVIRDPISGGIIGYETTDRFLQRSHVDQFPPELARVLSSLWFEVDAIENSPSTRLIDVHTLREGLPHINNKRVVTLDLIAFDFDRPGGGDDSVPADDPTRSVPIETGS